MGGATTTTDGFIVLHGILDNTESATRIQFIVLELGIYSVLYLTSNCDSINPSHRHMSFNSASVPSPTDFSILYIHCFVYTVNDDFSGQQSSPGGSGLNAVHDYTNNTATGGFSPFYSVAVNILLNLNTLSLLFFCTMKDFNHLVFYVMLIIESKVIFNESKM